MRAFPFCCLPLALSLPAQLSAQDMHSAKGGEDDYHAESPIIVTAPSTGRIDALGHVAVIEGEALAQQIRGQIGDSLTHLPGVSASSFSPGASRPILRGFSGERVAVLVDGLGAIDASSTSADHGVSIDPLTAQRIEVLHGPSVLMYSGQAIGGAINIIDRRIPHGLPEAPFHLDALASYGSAGNDKGLGASIDVPAGSQLVVHIDGNWRRAGDIRAGGRHYAAPLRQHLLELAADSSANGDAAEAARLTGATNARGRIPNSASRSRSAGVGAAFVDDGGSLGIAFSYLDSNYGIPPRADLGEAPTIAARQYRVDLSGEIAPGGEFIDRVKLRGAYGDYAHTEFDDGVPGTRFRNKGIEFRAEITQQQRGNWRGSSGVQYHFRDFAALGDEAFLPPNETRRLAAFTLQQLDLGGATLEAALRYEQTHLGAASIGYDRQFGALSGAAGFSIPLAPGLKASLALSHSERAPSAEELLSDGAHAATQSYQRGNPALARERSWGGEASVKFDWGGYNFALTAYASRFGNFLYESDTGRTIDGLPVFEYRQGPARNWGFEAEGRAPLARIGAFALSADLTADMTRAQLRGGSDLPRIPPLRLLGGLGATSDHLDLRAEVEWTASQNRLAPFETSTPGFALVNLSLNWRPLPETRHLSLTLAADNLFDINARRHASFTKDYVPLPGRDIRLTMRASF